MPDPPQAERSSAAPPVLAVGAVVVDEAGRVLLVQRGRPPGKGSWTLPGGRVEVGESLEAAIVRELLEETALRTRVVCALGPVTIDRDGYVFVIHEHLVVPEGDDPPRAGDDAADARWVPREAIDALGVRSDAIDVIDRGLSEAAKRGLVRLRFA